MRLGVLVLTLLAAGCSTYAAPRYSVSADTVSRLRALRPSVVSVGAFTATDPGRTEIMCRAVGPIKTPDGEPFEAFIRKALIDELTLAEVYAPVAPTVLTGHLEAIDFVTFGEKATWTIALKLTSSNGVAIVVNEVYPFVPSWWAEAACQQTAQALMPAVQNLVGQVVRHRDFPALLH